MRKIHVIYIILTLLLNGCILERSKIQNEPAQAQTESEVGSLEETGNGQSITPRQLVAAGALMGAGPSSFAWSPTGATLVYVAPQDGQDALWIYDPLSDEKRILLGPGNLPDQVDLISTQWSPNGENLLLSGGTSLWLLNIETGQLNTIGGESGVKTGLAFSPDGSQIAYVMDNDIYTLDLAGEKAVHLTSDGSETVFNGALDWVYNEELATRSSQPAYAWSPDGQWLIYLHQDETEVQNHSVTDYTTVPPTLSYTRYPVAGSPNPQASHFMIDLRSGVSSPIPMAEDVEYILPFFTWSADSAEEYFRAEEYFQMEAFYITENRAHTVLKLQAWDPVAKSGRTLIEETDPFWVNENSYAAPIFLGVGRQFLWLSEQDGFMHLYLYSNQGELIRQLTQGEWMIDTPAWNLLIPGRPVYVDPAGELAYFSATRNPPWNGRFTG